MSMTTGGSESKLCFEQHNQKTAAERGGPFKWLCIGLSVLLVLSLPIEALASHTTPARVSEIANVDLNRDAVRSEVAYNPDDMQYLVVWEGDGLADDTIADPPVINDDVDEIFGRIIDAASGMTIVTDFRISNMSDMDEDAANPAVVYNSANGEYLVVWQGGSGNQDEIFGQRLDPTGGELGADFQISTSPMTTDDRHAARPDVAWNDIANEYLVVWQDGAGNLNEILGQRVAGNGFSGGSDLIGGEFQISDIGVTGAGRSAANPAVAYNAASNNYLVAWEGNGLVRDPDAEAIFAQLLAADGTPSATPDIQVAPSRASRPDVAYNGVDNEFLVVFQTESVSSSTIAGQRLAPSVPTPPGQILLGSQFDISDSSQALAPSLTHGSGNNQYLVIWQTDLGGLRHEIFGRLVYGPGIVLGTGDGHISSVSNVELNRDAALPAVAYDDMENLYLVTFEADGLPDDMVANDRDDVTEIFAQSVEPFFPDLTLVKSDGDARAMPGDTVVYTLTYQNLGDGPAPNPVITETVPGSTVFAGSSTMDWNCAPDATAGSTCTIDVDTVLPGQANSVEFAVILDLSLPAGLDEISNSARIDDDGSGGADEDPGNNSASDTTPIDAAPDLRISKVDDGGGVSAGGTITYTLNYSNIGRQGAAGVVITETVPDGAVSIGQAGWSCPGGSPAGTVCTTLVGDLPVGSNGSAVFSVSVLNPAPAGLDQVVNTASIADDGSNGTDLNPGNNSARDTTPVNAEPQLLISKNDGGVTAGPGATVAYTLSYGNAGNQAASGVTITETVPVNTSFNATASTPGWSCADRSPAGTMCTLVVGELSNSGNRFATFAVTVDDPLPAGVIEITNTASIADDGANGPDPDPSNNTVTETTPVGTPDLQLSKDDGGISVAPGDVILYTLSYANDGNRDATGVVLSETVPADTIFEAGLSTPGWNCVPGAGAGSSCTLDVGPVSAGSNGSAVFAVTVDNPPASAITQVSNTASIADDGANGPDANPADNTASDTTPVQTPDEQTEAILEFIDDSVAEGTLSGSGPGGSASGRLGALINKINNARSLIAAGDISSACSELRSALRRTDGMTPPPDFVSGAAAAELAGEIIQLRTRLGCP